MIGRLAAAFLVGGVSGWLLENALIPESAPTRYSRAFAGRKVPFLPVYGFGALAVMGGAPLLAPLSWPWRAGAYAAGLAALELAACRIDRELAARRLPKAAPTPTSPDRQDVTRPAWDYSPQSSVFSPQLENKKDDAWTTKGCVDLPHAIAWGGLGLLAERLAAASRR